MPETQEIEQPDIPESKILPARMSEEVYKLDWIEVGNRVRQIVVEMQVDL